MYGKLIFERQALLAKIWTIMQSLHFFSRKSFNACYVITSHIFQISILSTDAFDV